MDAVMMPVEEIRLDPANVRKHNEKNLHAIMASLKRFGQQKPIVVGSDNIVIAGNGTLEAASALGWTELSAVKTNLTGDEAKAYAIADNRTAELAEWDIESLLEQVGVLEVNAPSLMDAVGFSADDIVELNSFVESITEDAENPYTAKIKIPIYEPKNEKPEIAELIDDDKTKSLTHKIMASDIPEEIRQFLIAAATRHTVFNFRKIADFYAHAKPEVQRLMEDSALVIIDFNKAIEDGFVRLNKKMLLQAAEESEDA